MTREEWLTRCAARYEERAGLHLKPARDFAEIALQGLIDTSEPAGLQPEDEAAFLDANSPEEEADGDMDCWTDDGDE